MIIAVHIGRNPLHGDHAYLFFIDGHRHVDHRFHLLAHLRFVVSDLFRLHELFGKMIDHVILLGGVAPDGRTLGLFHGVTVRGQALAFFHGGREQNNVLFFFIDAYAEGVSIHERVHIRIHFLNDLVHRKRGGDVLADHAQQARVLVGLLDLFFLLHHFHRALLYFLLHVLVQVRVLERDGGVSA